MNKLKKYELYNDECIDRMKNIKDILSRAYYKNKFKKKRRLVWIKYRKRNKKTYRE